MSDFPTTPLRLSFFDMDDEPQTAVVRAPSPARARLDQVASGHGAGHLPKDLHVVHWSIPIERGCELRVTTTERAIWIRRWHKGDGDASWWSTLRGSVKIDRHQARAFEQAVHLAVAALTGGKP
jgi:hypothetical protein